ncbi:helix-turn-helix domain-containing protein [Citrobacter freundii]|uniref:transcriptional regulator n=1 Tax=Citrobacter freundii complex TaxID=1344959 RepID=UPI0018839B7F|nr:MULTISPECIES: YdaS family helix-turn-helix protein [Citrobacter freundii complex]MBE9969116.1 helix-turn-helix domain-containing protein [Citrobacter freundii]MBE9976418.1 helix-turn-helix domain-containing protein [Citrobacter freundii]MBE9985761.1 helix-turn-helix domain-containing protein [Citrobacter freundii]MBF0065129.1 helix-turn-helix domain-containing protein [Citrobacter freundii]MCX8972618.1 helix-turn-helix domain-containing protein [Citrobacter portucalensis]
MNTVIQRAIDIAGSQTELARRIGTDQSSVSKWLNGSEISSRFILAIVTATGGEISAYEILKSLQK